MTRAAEPQPSLAGQPVFDVGGASYCWGDVVLAAVLRGDWAELDRQTREGIVCLKRMRERGCGLTREEVDQAADEFRYCRDLITAEETQTWLARWGLTVEGWLEYVERAALRQKWLAELPDILPRYAVSQEEVDRVIFVDAICSGGLARLARELAGLAAVSQAFGEEAEGDEGALDCGDSVLPEDAVRKARQVLGTSLEVCRERLAELGRLARRVTRSRQRVLTPKAIQATIRAHYLEWIRLECEYVSFPAEEQAREAALCIREDRRELEEVAARARTAARTTAFHLEELEPRLKDHFLRARPGELVGPLAWDREIALFVVRRKVLPSDADPATCARAAERAWRRAVEREIQHRVRWHHEL